MDLLPRAIEGELRDVMSVSRAAAILGPRQVGKSTLARQLQASGLVPHYYSLDDERLRAAANMDPDGLVASLSRPAIIDEVQRAPGLLLAIKQILDAEPRTPGQFLLTGSSNLLTNRHVADALPGRIEYVNLWPFSQGEIQGQPETLIDDLLASRVPQVHDAPRGRIGHADMLITGGFPEARTRDTTPQRARHFDSYLQGILGRDLPDLAGIRTDPGRVEQLLRLLAARSGGTVNYTRLANDLSVDQKTVKSHVDLLEQLYLVVALRPWSKNLGVRQTRAPKVFVSDTGLACTLLDVNAVRYAAPDQGELGGMLLETFVAMEIVKQRTWANQRVQLYFYRDHNGREVDLVLEAASGDVAAIEVKATASVDQADTKGLRFLRDRLGARFTAGIVVYTGAHTVPLGERLWAVPLSGLWTPAEAR